MWKKIGATLLIFLFVFAIDLAYTAAEDVIENNEKGIPDAGLYRTILQTLNKGEGETFTRQEAESVTMIWLNNGAYGQSKEDKVESFQGLGALKNLKEFTAADQGLTTDHLAEIAQEVPQLEALSLSKNNIDSLIPLKDMINLRFLWVPNNRLTSLEGIEGMSQLTSLEAYNNQLTNVKPLKHLTNLEELYLSENQLKSVKGIERLTNLVWLDLQDNQLKTLPNLKKLKKLYMANFTHNRLSQKQLKKNLPKRLFQKRTWKKYQFTLQKSNFKIVMTSPKHLSNVSNNTTKMTGRIQTNEKWNTYTVNLKISSSGKNKYLQAKVNKDKTFVFERLNLKKLKGSQGELYVVFKGFDAEGGDVVNRAVFTIQ